MLLIALLGVFAFGQGIPNVVGQPLPVQLEFLAMSLMVFGFALGWRWEGLGGLLGIGGFGLFCGTEMIVNGQLPGGALPLFAIPAVLFLASYGLSSHRRKLAAL
jgi:hypothetical protein